MNIKHGLFESTLSVSKISDGIQLALIQVGSALISTSKMIKRNRSEVISKQQIFSFRMARILLCTRELCRVSSQLWLRQVAFWTFYFSSSLYYIGSSSRHLMISMNCDSSRSCTKSQSTATSMMTPQSKTVPALPCFTGCISGCFSASVKNVASKVKRRSNKKDPVQSKSMSR